MKRWGPLLAVVLILFFLGGCAVENRVVAKKAWDAQPSKVAVVGEVNTDQADAKRFKDYLVKDIEIWMKLYKHEISGEPDVRLTVTVDQLDPGNRWLRWLAGIFGAGHGSCKGTVSVRKGGVLVGEYEYAGIQRGGTFGGTIKNMSNDVALGIARKITKQKFDEALFEAKK
ncbi:hypothetical protein ACFL27_18370 [candidate division CSSED10-310 bacterium]|uniref:DUF4410 domain-containing protein n=1 Tax=candidate division CSSED10-310 bacterium TaxID=2855610 RepID=A0ABV6Z169_UNCC1